MKANHIKYWSIILISVNLYALTDYIILFLNYISSPYTKTLTNIKASVAPFYIVTILITMFVLQKKHHISTKEFFSNKTLRILVIIMITLFWGNVFLQ